jgi:hypothetical protein
MAIKKQARESSHSTGIKNYMSKDTKRKRIIQHELARKWTNPPDVQTSKRHSS